MNRKKLNIKATRRCAFCKYWHDPGMSTLTPEAPKVNLWSFDPNEKRQCLKTNLEMRADAVCGKYDCKLKEYFN